MTIAVVGQGRVASCMMPALREAGHTVVCQNSRAQELTADAEVYLFCIKDDALPEVIGRMHRSQPDALMLHTSGSVPLSVFADAGHSRGGVLYPMQTFSKERTPGNHGSAGGSPAIGSALDFAAIHYFIEAAQPDDLPTIQHLAATLTTEAHIHHMPSQQRRQLHLAAVFACNFVNHCCTLAEEVLRPAGQTFDVMLPLLDETVAKLHQLSPAAAQTGPAVRWDQSTISRHLDMLSNAPLAQQIYQLMSESIREKCKIENR